MHSNFLHSEEKEAHRTAKMNVKVIISIVILTQSLMLLHSEAFISINIEPDDFDAVSDFLHQIMVNGRPVESVQSDNQALIVRHVKKVVFSIIQMLGIMLTLIGANLITTMLDYPVPAPAPNFVNHRPQISYQEKSVDNYSKIIDIQHAEKCNIDFGCDRNVCWRSCNVNVSASEKKMWCYTAPDQRTFHHQKCDSTSDCSLCWECIEPCHT